MTVALALTMVLSWGTWIPLAQAVPGVAQHVRTLYVTIGSLVFAAAAFGVGGGHVVIGWRTFWLPLAGGVVWTMGNYCAFRATDTIGLARAAGTWTPFNIVVAFAWGATVFGELDRFDTTRFVVLGAAFGLVVLGVRLVTHNQDVNRHHRSSGAGTEDPRPPPNDAAPANRPPPGTAAYRRGLLWAVTAGLMWGSYFVPAQWARVPALTGNFPLALGVCGGGVLLAVAAGGGVRVPARVMALEGAAGCLWGVGNAALLGLVTRVGTGAGFTIGQLALLVNASIGIWIFKVPRPGTRAARTVLVGILITGVGGAVIGALA